MRSAIMTSLGVLTAALMYAGPGGGTAEAGTVILEGSDAIDFHCNTGTTGAACDYKNQTWSAIGGADPRPILVAGSTTITSSTHPVVDFASLDSPGVGALSGYVAIYMATPLQFLSR